MTEQSAEPREGWYIATDTRGQQVCIRRCGPPEPGWWFGNMAARDCLPPGWTLGARIDDLMRDATRYRWLRQNLGAAEVSIMLRHTPEDVDLYLDAEIAREAGPHWQPLPPPPGREPEPQDAGHLQSRKLAGHDSGAMSA